MELELRPISAADELRFLTDAGRLLGYVLPAVGELDGAYAIACNCVTVFYATRGQLDGVSRPMDLLRAMDLGEIADLAERYHSQYGLAEGWEGAVNASWREGTDA